MAEGARFMRNTIGLAILAGAFSFAGGAEAAPPALSDHAAISRELAKPAEQAGRKARNKRYVKRRYDWTYYPYWRPYQYRYWKFYYPYGGPLF
jgi:hypothetical protein